MRSAGSAVKDKRASASRVAIAIACSSAASSALITVGFALLNATSVSASSADAVVAYLAWFALSFVITALVASTLGLAWHTYLQRHNHTAIHWYWIPGAIVGGMSGALWLLPSGSSLVAALITPLGAALGGATGFFAWLIRRPDRDAANPPTSPP